MRRVALIPLAAVGLATVAVVLPERHAVAPPEAPVGESRPARAHRPKETGRVLVRFREGARPDELESAAGGRKVAENARLKVRALATSDVRATLARLRGSGEVVWAEPEVVLERFADASTPERAELGFDALPDDPALRGRGVSVAVIDDGVYASNPDLVGRVDDGGDYSGDAPRPAGGTTPAGSHGTAVATVLAAARDGQGMVGAVPEARVVSFRVFSPTGGGTTYSVASAIVAAADRGVQVANLSLGSPFDSRMLRDAIAEARATNPAMVLVAASGNDGAERPSFPAGDPYVVSVGATERSGTGAWTVTDFSNKGDVDLVAPGRNVLAWYSDTGVPTAPRPVDGTSFSAPAVAGIFAALAGKGITGDRARAAVVAGTEPATGSPFPPVASGRGRADAPGAYATATGTAAYAAVFVDGGNQVANVVGRRTFEVLRYDPARSGAPIATASRGTVTGLTTQATGSLYRSTGTYTVPPTDQGHVDATLSAGGATAPLRLIEPTSGPEGPQAEPDVAQAPTLVHGGSSRFVQSAGLRAGEQLTLDFSYAPESRASLLYVWAPSTTNGTASAADPPVAADGGSNFSGTLRYTAPRTGRYVFGFLLESPDDDGVYRLTARFAAPSATLDVTDLSTRVSPTTSVPVRWGSPSGGAVAYDVEYTEAVRTATGWTPGPWRAWRANTTATSGTFTGLPGRTYSLRVRARDDLGNAGAAVTRNLVVPLDDRYGSVVYTAGWTAGAAGNRFAQTLRSSRTAGAAATFTAETNRFVVVGERFPDCGQVRVYVDGVLKAIVDTRGAGYARQVLYDSGTLAGGVRKHSLKLVVVGTRGRPRVSLDAIALVRL